MDVYEALKKAKTGGLIKAVGHSDDPGFFITKKALCYDNGDEVVYGFDCEWEEVTTKIKVTIDGKEGYISKESADELKRML